MIGLTIVLLLCSSVSNVNYECQVCVCMCVFCNVLKTFLYTHNVSEKIIFLLLKCYNNRRTTT